jgi:hypothetical protein
MKESSLSLQHWGEDLEPRLRNGKGNRLVLVILFSWISLRINVVRNSQCVNSQTPHREPSSSCTGSPCEVTCIVRDVRRADHLEILCLSNFCRFVVYEAGDIPVYVCLTTTVCAVYVQC